MVTVVTELPIAATPPEEQCFISACHSLKLASVAAQPDPNAPAELQVAAGHVQGSQQNSWELLVSLAFAPASCRVNPPKPDHVIQRLGQCHNLTARRLHWVAVRQQVQEHQSPPDVLRPRSHVPALPVETHHALGEP